MTLINLHKHLIYYVTIYPIEYDIKHLARVSVESKLLGQVQGARSRRRPQLGLERYKRGRRPSRLSVQSALVMSALVSTSSSCAHAGFPADS